MRIEEPTCLVLGAGASHPYGLPLANELRELILVRQSDAAAEIAAKFPVQDLRSFSVRMGARSPVQDWGFFLEAVSEDAGLGKYLGSFWDNFFAADRSIDWFLRHNDESFGRIARLQIAAVLLSCERESSLSGDWYRSLLNRIFETEIRAFENGKLAVITFNYDRSFERYFQRVLEKQYRLPPAEATEILNRITIKHVYGHLGSLTDVPYGDVTKASVAADGISLVRPQVNEELRRELGEIIQRSYNICFLGFGFDPDNIAQLGPENFKGKTVLSTSRGISSLLKRDVQKQIRIEFGPSGANMTAAELLSATDIFAVRPRAPRSIVVRRPDWGKGWKV